MAAKPVCEVKLLILPASPVFGKLIGSVNNKKTVLQSSLQIIWSVVSNILLNALKASDNKVGIDYLSLSSDLYFTCIIAVTSY